MRWGTDAAERLATCCVVHRTELRTRSAYAGLINPNPWRHTVLYTIALILLILWVLGLVTSFTAGGLVHLLVVAAIVIVIYQLVTGRRIG